MIGKPTRSTQLRILVNGATLPERGKLNFIGTPVTVADNPAENRTDVTIVGGEGGVGGDASDVAYNTTYPTVAAALDALLYVPPDISSLSNNVGTVEIGSTVSTVLLSWALNKAMVSLQLNQGIGMIDPAAVNYLFTTPFTSNLTFTVTASDGVGSDVASTTVAFSHKRYWGVSANQSLTDAGVLGLSSEFSSSRAQSKALSPSGQYLYFAYPAAWGEASFTINGLPNTAWTLVSRAFLNASNNSTLFNIYRSNNLLTGTYTVGVS